MALPDGLRHVLAVVAACAAFLGAYLGADLVAWLALALAGAIYAAALLLLRRRPTKAEIMVAERVSAADLAAARAALEDAAGRIETAAAAIPIETGLALSAMSGDLRTIAENVAVDPQDYLKTRRFIGYYLPQMVQSVENYSALAARSGESERLRAIGARIEAYRPVVGRIKQACLENDFDALEVEVEALETQLARRVR